MKRISKKYKINQSYKNTENNFNPINIRFLKNIVNDSFSKYWIDNMFCLFKSINDILYLIYSKDNSIICYNIIDDKKIIEIKNAHYRTICNFRNYLDKSNKRDLIISISPDDNNLKLWDAYNWECLVNIEKVNQSGYLWSACLLNDNNNIYIITSNYIGKRRFIETSNLKVFDLKGKITKELKDSNYDTSFIDIYYDYDYDKSKPNKIYIITGNDSYISSYDYNQNKIYHKYLDFDTRMHNSIIINNEEIVKLIESSCGGYIRIWNFHTAQLLKKIKVSNEFLKGICLWDNEYIFTACQDNTIKLINLKDGKIIKNLEGHKEYVLTIKSIIHPIYGKCLVSKGDDKEIKLWIIKR